MDALQQLNLAAPIANTYGDVENMLLCHIAEQLAANPDTLINATSEWRIKMLAQMGRLNRDSAKIIASMVGKVPSEVEAVVNTAINGVLEENGLTMTDKVSGGIAETLENYDRQAVKSKYNQVNTVMQYKAKQAYVNGVNSVADRFARIQQKALANSQEYLDVLNDNALAVVMGEKSRTEALRETINQMCSKGIPAFVDASGKEWSPEAYVNMDIRNTAKNSALAAQWGCMDELDQDVILVSSHSGARPLCAKYQGKFYSRKDKSGVIKDARGKEYRYEPLSSTSFGEPAGLFGINCGHRMRGVSDGAFINREKQYDEDENTEEYKQVCEQRRQERKIRTDKTKRDALKAAGDDEGAKALSQKIAAENKQLKAYCEQNGLAYQADRIQTYGYSDKSKVKAVEDFVETTTPSKATGSKAVDNGAESGIIKTEERIIVDGKDMTGDFVRRKDEFKYEIDDIVDAQGYNGKPLIVDNKEEFDKLVQEDHFIGERTFHAETAENLQDYINELRNGDFYVNCETGGHQYGRGMYCAADYTKGERFDGFAHEIEQYSHSDIHDFAHTEWLTMDKSAKILEIPIKEKENEYISARYRDAYLLKHATADTISDINEYIKAAAELDRLYIAPKIDYDLIDIATDRRTQAFIKIKPLINEAMSAGANRDIGVLAAEMGYDAINAAGHGTTGSYTVVLNRTKLIIFGGDKYV